MKLEGGFRAYREKEERERYGFAAIDLGRKKVQKKNWVWFTGKGNQKVFCSEGNEMNKTKGELGFERKQSNKPSIIE